MTTFDVGRDQRWVRLVLTVFAEEAGEIALAATVDEVCTAEAMAEVTVAAEEEERTGSEVEAEFATEEANISEILLNPVETVREVVEADEDDKVDAAAEESTGAIVPLGEGPGTGA
jgi:hypothetical protein